VKHKITICSIMVLFSIVFFSSVAQNRGDENNIRLDSLINIVIFQTYNEEWVNASQTIDVLQEKYSLSPIPSFFRGTLYFRKLYSTLNPECKDSAKKYFDDSYTLSENILLVRPSDTVALFYHAGSSGYLGLYYAYDKSYYSAVKYGLEAIKGLNAILQKDSTYYDSYLGLGIYTYSAGKIPAFLRWIFHIGGITADVQIGLEYLNKSASLGRYTNYEAMDKLANFYIAEKEYSQANSLINTLRARFPHSSWFVFLDELNAFKAKEWNNVIKVSDEYLKLNNRSKPYVHKTQAYQIEALYKSEQYSEAVHKSQDVDYEYKKDQTNTAIIEYYMAKSFEKLGKIEDAKIHFSNYIKLANELGFDKDEDYEYAQSKIQSQ
jgi:hypothetical protein